MSKTKKSILSLFLAFSIILFGIPNLALTSSAIVELKVDEPEISAVSTDSEVTLSWTKATVGIDSSELLYSVYSSNTDNIGTVEEINNNGTCETSQHDIDTYTVDGLTENT